ncbi:hypothetical protein C8D83_1203 [Halothiobacillus neapolitanus]|nr:hypothetical protein C8D83_1203 [Halothiobacillus neapolitanus]
MASISRKVITLVRRISFQDLLKAMLSLAWRMLSCYEVNLIQRIDLDGSG